MVKKYFVRLCNHCDPKDPDFGVVHEVSHVEYVTLANQEVFAHDVETMERIMESATRDAGVCGSRHLFWTEDDNRVKNPMCPDCNVEMDVLMFMGVEPEGFVCPKCNRLFNDEMKPMAIVIS